MLKPKTKKIKITPKWKAHPAPLPLRRHLLLLDFSSTNTPPPLNTTQASTLLTCPQSPLPLSTLFFFFFDHPRGPPSPPPPLSPFFLFQPLSSASHLQLSPHSSRLCSVAFHCGCNAVMLRLQCYSVLCTFFLWFVFTAQMQFDAVANAATSTILRPHYTMRSAV